MRTMERLPVACLCLLLSCSAVGSAGSRVDVFEDSDVILPCSLNTKEDITLNTFDWTKDPQKDVFLYDAGIYYNNGLSGQDNQFRGRVSHFPDELQHGNASIIIRKTKLADSGNYTCHFPRLQPPQTSHIELVVGSAGSRVDVKEDSDAILPCSLSTKEDIRSKLFDWKKDGQKEVFLYDNGPQYNNGLSGQHDQFRGRVSHFPDELQHGNASITIRKTKVVDSGKYTCVFPRLQPEQPSHIELVVAAILKDRSAENLPGAAPKPCVTILDQTNDQALLQCEVQGASPKPEVKWRNSSGNILPAEEPLVSERGGSFYITIKTTVTKTDTYHCVATQKEINHQIEAKIHVHISGVAAKPSVKILHQTNHQALLQCEVKGASPKPKVEWKDSSGNILHAEEPLVSERGNYSDIILNITVTKTDRYRCVATQKEIYHQTEADTYVYISELNSVRELRLESSGWVVPVLFAIIAVLVLVVVILCIKQKRGSTSASQPAGGEEVALKDSSSKEATEP